MNESERLRSIVAPLFEGQAGWRAALPSGGDITVASGADDQDDCAILEVRGDVSLVVGTDYVRGPKFALYELGKLNNYDLGWYLAGANFSDIAAMGAVPFALFSVVRYPHEMPVDEFRAVLEGIRDGCASVGAINAGGDIGGAERLFLSATALGVVEPGRSLTRARAAPGDILCVTGPTGLAGSALRYFRGGCDGLSAGDIDALLCRWRRVQPRIAQGAVLGRSGATTACTDTSDGLYGSIESLAERSRVGFLIDEVSVPIHASVLAASGVLGVSALELAFGDSVDFELAATVTADGLEPMMKAFFQDGLELYPIGVATENRTVLLKRADGVCVPVPGEPWRHA